MVFKSRLIAAQHSVHWTLRQTRGRLMGILPTYGKYLAKRRFEFFLLPSIRALRAIIIGWSANLFVCRLAIGEYRTLSEKPYRSIVRSETQVV